MMYPRDIARAIMADLSDRRGLGDELDQVDDDVREEILDAWVEIIKKGSPASGETKS